MQNLPDLNFKYDPDIMFNVFKMLLSTKAHLPFGQESGTVVVRPI